MSLTNLTLRADLDRLLTSQELDQNQVNLRDILDQVASGWFSEDPPSVTIAGMLWTKRSTGVQYRRSVDNESWIAEREVFKELQNKAPNLTALTDLVGANGSIPVFTGVGAMARRPIVGTASQSGGVPTGSIVESGSNANGLYWRYAGGMQACLRFNIIIPPHALNAGSTVDVAAAAAFADSYFIGAVQVVGQYNGSGAHVDVGSLYTNGMYMTTVNATVMRISTWGYSKALTTGVILNLLTIGRWHL